MKSPKILYILIAIFCVFAIIAGIYAQIIEGGDNQSLPEEQDKEHSETEYDIEGVKAQFNDLFTNTINLNGTDTTGINKLKDDQEIVYTAYDINKKETSYEMNIHIPVININSEVAKSFNQTTQAIFVNKANEISKKTDTTTPTIYSIDYVAFVNGDILSVAIKSTLKEEQNAQRVIVQTYNYNLSTGERINLNDIITKKSLNKDDVNNIIKTIVQEADSQAKAIQDMGYNTNFSRDLTSNIYTVENSGTFLLANNNNLYVIYAYGNQNFTSEMDIVLFE